MNSELYHEIACIVEYSASILVIPLNWVIWKDWVIQGAT